MNMAAGVLALPVQQQTRLVPFSLSKSRPLLLKFFHHGSCASAVASVSARPSDRRCSELQFKLRAVRCGGYTDSGDRDRERVRAAWGWNGSDRARGGFLGGRAERRNVVWSSEDWERRGTSGFVSGAGARARCMATVTEDKVETTDKGNPLLEDAVYPLFDAVEASHVIPGIRALLEDLEKELVELEENVQPTWPGLVEPLEKIVDRLSVAWGTVSHLKAVKDSPELRTAVEEVQPNRVAFSLRLGQSKPIYEAFKAIREGPVWGTLSEAQQRIVDGELKEATLNGVGLEGESRTRFNEIQQELEQLSTKFSENVLDATKKFQKLITDPKDIEGLPPTALGLAAQTAALKGHEGATAEKGPWVITLDAPSYMPVMQHVRNRDLREELYRAYLTRASSGDLDNTLIIEKTLQLRQEKAELLGFKNHAEVSMAMKMATLERAEDLLEQLRSTSWDPAVKGVLNTRGL